MPYPLPSGSHTGLGKRNYLLPILAKNNLGLPSSIQSRRSRIKLTRRLLQKALKSLSFRNRLPTHRGKAFFEIGGRNRHTTSGCPDRKGNYQTCRSPPW